MFLIDLFIVIVKLVSGFCDYVGFVVQIKQFVYFGNVFVIYDVEFYLFEWRCDFIFYNFYVGCIVYNFIVVF